MTNRLIAEVEYLRKRLKEVEAERDGAAPKESVTGDKLPQRLRLIADFMEDHGIGVGDHCDAPTLKHAADEIERLRELVNSLAERCHHQSDLLAAKAERK